MSSPTPSASHRSGWSLVGIAFVATLIIWPVAARFYSPTAIGYVQLPGVLLFGALAVGCAICFFRCPRHPLAPKLTSLLFTAHALYWSLDSGAYYWLHFVYHA